MNNSIPRWHLNQECSFSYYTSLNWTDHWVAGRNFFFTFIKIFKVLKEKLNEQREPISNLKDQTSIVFSNEHISTICFFYYRMCFYNPARSVLLILILVPQFKKYMNQNWLWNQTRARKVAMVIVRVLTFLVVKTLRGFL